MPRQKSSNLVGFRFIVVMYILGLYGGLVSGLIVSAILTKPSASVIWDLGIGLVLLGIVILVVIDRLLRRKSFF